MYALTILFILATRVIFGQGLDSPHGLAQVSVGDGRYLFSPNQIYAPSGTQVRFFFYGVSSSLACPDRPVSCQCLSILRPSN